MNKRKIASSALIVVGAFFIVGVLILTVADSFTEMEPGYRVAGAIQTVSGQAYLIVGIALLAIGIKFGRKPKPKPSAIP